MKNNLTLEECELRYKFYANKFCNALNDNETDMIKHYANKLFDLIQYVDFTFGKDLNDIE